MVRREHFIIGRDFIGKHLSALILGGNLVFWRNLASHLSYAAKQVDGTTVFAYQDHDPQRCGVAEFNEAFRALSCRTCCRLGAAAAEDRYRQSLPSIVYEPVR